MIPEDIKRFTITGVGSNVVNLACYFAAIGIGTGVFGAAVIGYLCGLAVSFHFGRTWVFGQRFTVTGRRLVKFCVVYALGGLGMSVVTNMLYDLAGFSYFWAWFFGAGYAAVNNYVGQRWLVFRGAV